MNFTLVDWLIFFSVPLITWAIGMRNRSIGTWRGYFLAQGSLPTVNVAATYFGANLTFTAIFLVLSEEGYRRGYWVFSVPAFWIVGTFIFKGLYKKIQPYIKEGMTLHQAIGEAFHSKFLQKIASIWTIIAFVGTVGLEFYGGVKLLQWLDIPLLNSFSLALLLAFIVASFTALGGFRSVSVADIILDLVTFSGVGVIIYYLFSSFTIATIFSTPQQEAINNLISAGTSIKPIWTDIGENIAFVLGMACIFIPFQLCTLDSWQRLAAWEKKETSLNKVLVIPSIALALIYCVPILLGMAVVNYGISIPSDSHPLRAFLDFVHIPPFWIGIVITGFIAAMFSTADELLNCSSLSLLFDTFRIPRSDEHRTQHQQNRIVFAGQVYTAIFAFAAAIIAVATLWQEKKISEWALAVFSTQVVFTFPLLVALYWKNNAPRYKNIAVISMIVSFLLALICIGVGWVTATKVISDSAPIVAFIVAGAIFGLFSLFKK